MLWQQKQQQQQQQQKKIMLHIEKKIDEEIQKIIKI